MNKLLYKAFVAPFTSIERSILYLCAFLGRFGSFGIIVYLAFDYTSENLSIVLSFFIGNFILISFVLLPLLFTLLKRFISPGFILFCIALQIVSIVNIYFHPEFLQATTWLEGLRAGILIGVVNCPFWALFHNLMLFFTTRENRGHEVSIAELGLKFGAIVASMTSGIMLTYLPGTMFPIACMATITISTIILAMVTMDFVEMVPDKTTRVFSPYAQVFQRKKLGIATLFQAALMALIEFFVPIWMKFFGFSAILTGSVLIAQILIRTLISPLTGALFERKNGSELRLGSVFFIIGWLPWLFISHGGILIFSFINWAISNHTINVGMDSRWYDEKTLEGMATRELLLGLGRLFCLVTIMPLLLISPHAFIISCIVLALVFMGVSYLVNKIKIES